MSDAKAATTTTSFFTVSKMQSRNWEGCIPIELSLASTSVSSPTIPPPIHTLVSRNTYLHVGLRTAVQRLQSFALILSPTIQQRANLLQVTEPDPGTQSQKEEGDKNDLARQIQSTNISAGNRSIAVTSSTDMNSLSMNSMTYPVCWFEDEGTKMPLRWQYFAGILYDMKANKLIPWRIKLHFTNYPSSQILPLEYPNDVLLNVQTFYKHSLKQAMAVVSGNSKSAMNITKESHELLWDAITNGNYSLYRSVDLKIVTAASTTTTSTKQPWLMAIPIRILVNATSPPIQRRIDGNRAPSLSLGQVLHEWLPEHFSVVVPSNEEGSTGSEIYKSNDESVQCWRICGIEPPLSTNIYDLWRNCSYPDHFLHIIVLTR